MKLRITVRKTDNGEYRAESAHGETLATGKTIAEVVRETRRLIERKYRPEPQPAR